MVWIGFRHVMEIFYFSQNLIGCHMEALSYLLEAMGYTWLGPVYNEKHVSYNLDGSILYDEEASAYQHMYTRSMTTGRESMCLLLTDGKVLVTLIIKQQVANSLI